MKIIYQKKIAKNIKGAIENHGAKNLVTKIMLCSLLSNSKNIILNIPCITEVAILIELLTKIGVKFLSYNNCLIIDPLIGSSIYIINQLICNRLSILLSGMLLKVNSGIFLPIPLGDNIGLRNIDYHVNILKKNDVFIKYKEYNYYIYKKNNANECTYIYMYNSVGATETGLFTCIKRDKHIFLLDMAMEPEVVIIKNILRKMGILVWYLSEGVVLLIGMRKIFGIYNRTINDRLDFFSWISFISLSKGYIEISKILNNKILLHFLKMGLKIGKSYININKCKKVLYNKKLENGIRIITDIYPGTSTDYQSIFQKPLYTSKGISLTHETVYDNRIRILKMINKLNMRNKIFNQCLGEVKCKYYGKNKIHSSLLHKACNYTHNNNFKLQATDIRSGFLCFSINDNIKIFRSSEIERGYGNLVNRLIFSHCSIKRIIKKK